MKNDSGKRTYQKDTKNNGQIILQIIKEGLITEINQAFLCLTGYNPANARKILSPVTVSVRFSARPFLNRSRKLQPGEYPHGFFHVCLHGFFGGEGKVMVE